MVHKINAQLFDNKFFTIKNDKTNSSSVTVHCIDIQYSNQYISQSPSTVPPMLFQKTFKFNPINILFERNFMSDYRNEINHLYNNIKNTIFNDFFKKVAILGEQNRLTNIKFDIDISEIKKNSSNIGRSIIARLNNASNYIASQGRLGPAQWFASNNKTYVYILSYMTDLNLTYNNDGQLMIGNAPFIINDLIDDDMILLGRKNSIEQPGIHCIFKTDSDSNIRFQEYSSIGYRDNINFITEYAMDDIGSKPCLQYFKINTRSIGYYRKLKLQRLKEIMNNE